MPRGKGAELQASWLHRGGYWRLAVYDRNWNEKASVYTNVPTSEPRPSDDWLTVELRFVPLGDSEWTWNKKYDCWERDVARGPDTPDNSGTSDT